MNLDERAIAYRLDKSVKYHNYARVYDWLFTPIKDEVKKIMEIGVAGGRSLKMWRDYFPNAIVYGIDNEKKYLYNAERIQCYLADQSKKFDLEILKDELKGNFDIIIDDGSHFVEDQALSATVLIDAVREGGYYIIEDVKFPDRLRDLILPLQPIEVITSLWNGNSRLFVIQK